MPKTHQLNFTSAFAIWAALGFFAALYGTWLGQGGRPFAVTLAVLVLFLAVQIFLGARNVTESLLARLGRRSALAVALFPFAAYLFYAVTAIPFDWKWVAFGTVYVLVPALFVFLARDSAPGNWKDYAAVLAIWLPVELRWLYVLWPYPPLLTHTLTILLALNVGLAAFLLIRRLDGVGYQVEWGRGFGWAVGFHLLGFAAIAIPLGLAMGFLVFEPSLARLRSFPITALGILLFTAWPEEFLFRGLLQNLLSRTLRNPFAGLLAAAVIFGLAHINNGPFPNWRYVVLATIAGFFYGRAWMKTGSLFVSCLVHALVDIIWHLLFR